MARLDGSGTSGRGCGIGGSWIGRSGDLGLGRRFRSTVEVSGFKFQVGEKVSGGWCVLGGD